MKTKEQDSFKHCHSERASAREESAVCLCGAGALARELKRLKLAASLLLSMLREVFDESAYARFLARHRVAHSREAYADFLRENELVKARRPRCC